MTFPNILFSSSQITKVRIDFANKLSKKYIYPMDGFVFKNYFGT